MTQTEEQQLLSDARELAELAPEDLDPRDTLLALAATSVLCARLGLSRDVVQQAIGAGYPVYPEAA